MALSVLALVFLLTVSSGEAPKPPTLVPLAPRPAALVPAGQGAVYADWLRDRAFEAETRAHGTCEYLSVGSVSAAVPIDVTRLPITLKPKDPVGTVYVERVTVGGCSRLSFQTLVVYRRSDGTWVAMEGGDPKTLIPPEMLAAEAKARPPVVITDSVPRTSPVHAQPIISRPDWISVPTAEDFNTDYPPDARKTATGGRAAIDCVVTAQGRLTDCRIISETPTGMGIGEATLKLAHKIVMRPTLADGAPVGGAHVVVPVRWSIN